MSLQALNKGKVYGNFVLDICLYTSQLIWALVLGSGAIILGLVIIFTNNPSPQQHNFLTQNK